MVAYVSSLSRPNPVAERVTRTAAMSALARAEKATAIPTGRAIKAKAAAKAERTVESLARQAHPKTSRRAEFSLTRWHVAGFCSREPACPQSPSRLSRKSRAGSLRPLLFLVKPNRRWLAWAPRYSLGCHTNTVPPVTQMETERCSYPV
jgi:hypothetical protein